MRGSSGLGGKRLVCHTYKEHSVTGGATLGQAERTCCSVVRLRSLDAMQAKAWSPGLPVYTVYFLRRLPRVFAPRGTHGDST